MQDDTGNDDNNGGDNRVKLEVDTVRFHIFRRENEPVSELEPASHTIDSQLATYTL